MIYANFVQFLHSFSTLGILLRFLQLPIFLEIVFCHKQNVSVGSVHNMLEAMYRFFSQSTKRNKVIENVTKETEMY